MEPWEKFPRISEMVQARRPLLHHITNYVTAGFCADAALAAGALPMMTDSPEEVEDAVEKADALVCNLGTFSAAHGEAMAKAARWAKVCQVPVLLDPVGTMTSPLRRETALLLLAEGAAVLKGNGAEARSLLEENGSMEGRGVDSLPDALPGKLAKELACKFSCAAVITGPTDALSDGKRSLLARNGSFYQQKITGAGCMTGSLMAAGIAVADTPLEGALWGLTLMNVAAEKAEKACQGPGSFRMALLDAIYQTDGQELLEKFQGGWDAEH